MMMRKTLIGLVLFCCPAYLFAAKETFRVVLWGDSTMLSQEVAKGVNYSDWVKRFLKRKVEEKVIVEDVIVEPGAAKKFREDIQEYQGKKPSVMVLIFGYKDMAGNDPDVFRAEYESIIKDLLKRFSGSPLILATNPPPGSHLKLSNKESFHKPKSLIDYCNKIIRKLAHDKHLPLVDCYSIIRNAELGGEDIENLVQADKAQPTALGNLLLGSMTADKILTVLRLQTGSAPIVQYSNPTKKNLNVKNIPSKAELKPFLSLWDKYLVKSFYKRLEDLDSNVREQTLQKFQKQEIFSEKLLTIITRLLGDPGNRVSYYASRWFDIVIKDHHLSIFNKLLSSLKKDRKNSYFRENVLPLLLSCIKQNNRSNKMAEDGEIILSDKDLNFFVDMLQSKDSVSYDKLCRGVIPLIMTAGDRGLKKLEKEMDVLDQEKTVALLKSLSRYKVLRTYIKQFIIDHALDSSKPSLANYCLDQLSFDFSSEKNEIPMNILIHEFTNRFSGKRMKALIGIALRGEESIDTLIELLKSEDKDVAQSSSLMLLQLGFSLDSKKASEKAFSAARQFFSPRELLFALEIVLGPPSYRSTQSLYKPLSQTIYGHYSRFFKNLIPKSRIYRVPWDIRRSESQNSYTFNAYYYRIKEFLPILEKFFNKGNESEKETAENLIFQAWSTARDIEKHKQEILEAEKAGEKTAGSKPAGHFLRGLSSLADDLGKEALEQLRLGNKDLFQQKLRQALVATSTPGKIYNSIAWTLATTREDILRDPVKAEKMVRKAISIEGRNSVYLDTLAASLAGQEKFSEAYKTEIEAIENIKINEYAAGYTSRAFLYLNKKPYINKTR